MLATLANLAGPVLAIFIAAPPGPDDACPNARQVTDALQAHVPGVLVPADRAGLPSRPDVLRTVLEVPSDGTVVRFTLIDARGDVQLRRVLPGPGRGRPVADCVALADTLATIVERYLVSVPFQARETEPPPPLAAPTPAPAVAPTAETIVARPAPRATSRVDEQGRAVRVYAAAAWRAATVAPSPLLEAQLGGEVDLTRGAHRLAARLRAAVDEGQSGGVNGGSVSLRRFSGRLGLSLALPAGPGALEPALEGGLDLFVAQTTGSGAGSSAIPGTSVKPTPVGELSLGYRVTLLRHVFLRPQASLGFAIVRYDAWYGNEVVFRTPHLFSTFGLALGAVFR